MGSVVVSGRPPATPFSPELAFPTFTNWVVPGWYCNGLTQSAPTVGELHYQPIYVPATRTYDAIGCRVAVAGGVSSLARLGIYHFRAGAPDALVLDAGTVAVDSTGDKEIILGTPVTLRRALYFLALISDGSPQIFALTASDALAPVVQGYNTGTGQAPRLMLPITTGRGGDIAGGLPNPAPAVDARKTPGHAFVSLREQ